MNSWRQLFSVDWGILMAAANQWLQGGNPYGTLAHQIGTPGAFAYPPTALTWLSLFVPFGAWGYSCWTALELCGWWLLIRRRFRSQLVLFFWSPLLFHLLLGQTTLAVVLVLWAATLARRRGFWWGMALAWTLTKPQAALLPILWMVWHDRTLPHRHLLWSGIAVGSAALALPPTLMNPGIWQAWLASLVEYRARTMLMAPWQGFGIVVLLAAFLLWFHRHRENQEAAGWQWWLSAALFPQGALYSSVVLVPLLRPTRHYWTIAGLALSSVLIGPATVLTLPIILSGHILAAWFICGGPRSDTRESAPEAV